MWTGRKKTHDFLSALEADVVHCTGQDRQSNSKVNQFSACSNRGLKIKVADIKAAGKWLWRVWILAAGMSSGRWLCRWTRGGATNLRVKYDAVTETPYKSLKTTNIVLFDCSCCSLLLLNILDIAIRDSSLVQLYCPALLLSWPLYPFFARTTFCPSNLPSNFPRHLLPSFLLSIADVFFYLLALPPLSPPSILFSVISLSSRSTPPSVSGSAEEAGREGEGGADSPSFSRYLIKMAVRANCNYQSLYAATPPRLRVCVRTVWLRTVLLSMCECASMSVLIVLGWIRLISDSPERPAMTCLPHIPRCPLNADERCLPVLVCIWNYLMFTDLCLMNADSKHYHAMQTTSMIACLGGCCGHIVWS